MNTKYDFEKDQDRIVYVKSVAVADLPAEVQKQAEGLDHLFAVHKSDGEQLALVADRKMAFLLAREHEYQPMTVH